MSRLTLPQALFAASIILLVEKLFLQFVAINFHQKALADRLAENRLGLKALDLLSNTRPTTVRRTFYGGKRGHKSPGSSASLSGMKTSNDSSPVHEKDETTPMAKPKKNTRHADRERKKKKKPMASVIIDQVGRHSTRLSRILIDTMFLQAWWGHRTDHSKGLEIEPGGRLWQFALCKAIGSPPIWYSQQRSPSEAASSCRR